MPLRPVRFGSIRPKPKPLDRRRGTSTQRGYDAAWRRARLRFLANHPLCAHCLEKGRTTIATDVDHREAVTGPRDPRFWDVNNWQPLCHSCHSRKTVKEDGGFGE